MHLKDVLAPQWDEFLSMYLSGGAVQLLALFWALAALALQELTTRAFREGGA